MASFLLGKMPCRYTQPQFSSSRVGPPIFANWFSSSFCSARSGLQFKLMQAVKEIKEEGGDSRASSSSAHYYLYTTLLCPIAPSLSLNAEGIALSINNNNNNKPTLRPRLLAVKSIVILDKTVPYHGKFTY